jgi:hypothetical protein
MAIKRPSMNRSTAVGTSAPAASNQRRLAFYAPAPAMKPVSIGTGQSISCCLG